MGAVPHMLANDHVCVFAWNSINIDITGMQNPYKLVCHVKRQPVGLAGCILLLCFKNGGIYYGAMSLCEWPGPILQHKSPFLLISFSTSCLSFDNHIVIAVSNRILAR